MDSDKLLTRGVEEVIVKEHLEEALKSRKKLRVKFGIDPTAPDLHLGHAVPLRKLRQFQDAGHTAVLIIGDFTAMIGDPAGRSEERRPLTVEQVKKNMKDYLAQAGKIINLKKAKVLYNSKWLNKKTTEDFIELARAGTMQQVLHRADFKNRLDAGQDITMLEIFYPLMQGYDSVMAKADVEIGGTDQKFNLLMGRRVQRHFDVPEQDVITVPLLVGTDGEKKMSKSVGNYIGIAESPEEIFGKIMRVPDELIDQYYKLCTDYDRKNENPREAKLELGRIIVSMYHGEKAGEKAKENFIKVFSEHEKPADRPKRKELAGKNIVDALMASGATDTTSATRRLIDQGGVEINDRRVKDYKEVVPPNATVKAGKRHYFDT